PGTKTHLIKPLVDRDGEAEVLPKERGGLERAPNRAGPDLPDAERFDLLREPSNLRPTVPSERIVPPAGVDTGSVGVRLAVAGEKDGIRDQGRSSQQRRSFSHPPTIDGQTAPRSCCDFRVRAPRAAVETFSPAASAERIAVSPRECTRKQRPS